MRWEGGGGVDVRILTIHSNTRLSSSLWKCNILHIIKSAKNAAEHYEIQWAEFSERFQNKEEAES